MFGVTARPMDTLRINADFLLGYNDNSFTRISPRQVQSYKVHARYNPKPWASLDASVDINENRDNVSEVNNIEHGRAYSAVATLSPKSTFWIDFGYSYLDIYTQTEICFVDTGSTVFTAANSPCPIAASVAAGVTLGTLSYYASRDNYAYVDTMWKPQKRVTAMLGYGGSVVRGSTTFLNALTPAGCLILTYLKPFVSVAFDLHKGLSYKKRPGTILAMTHARPCESGRARAPAIRGLQREQCHVFVPVFVLRARMNEQFAYAWRLAAQFSGEGAS